LTSFCPGIVILYYGQGYTGTKDGTASTIEGPLFHDHPVFKADKDDVARIIIITSLGTLAKRNERYEESQTAERCNRRSFLVPRIVEKPVQGSYQTAFGPLCKSCPWELLWKPTWGGFRLLPQDIVLYMHSAG
jgi:hypothetical protein